MSKERSLKRDPLARLFAALRPNKDELAELKAAERSKDLEQFVRRLGELDRKYKMRSLETLVVDEKLINTEAFRPASEEIKPAYPVQSHFEAIVGQLAASKQLACDCIVRFWFRRLNVYNNMSGPERNEVARGLLGARRDYANEYSVWNPGDTDGKTRVHINGQMHITFDSGIPEAGRWCLILPSGNLYVRGHSRVVGHGNMTTSYDAKVWVDYYQVISVGDTLVEISGGDIHYDGTRSEDRTMNFNADRNLPPRYLFFNAPRAGDTLSLSLRIEVDTAANEDGLATGVIDMFGFPANTTRDYDSFVIKVA